MENSFFNYFNQRKDNLSFSRGFENGWVTMYEEWNAGSPVEVFYDSFSAFIAGGEL